LRIKKINPKKYLPPKQYFPGDFFGNALKIISVFSKSPCRETPKNALKKKEKVRAYFFLRAGADVRRFPVFFSAAPCKLAAKAKEARSKPGLSLSYMLVLKCAITAFCLPNGPSSFSVLGRAL
jgi:hypothetical protein